MSVVIFSDAFPETSFASARWTKAENGPVSLISQLNAMLLTLYSTTGTYSRVTSKAKFLASGITTIKLDWTPARRNTSSTVAPYIALVPDDVQRNSLYQWPLAVPTIKLGAAGNTTTASILYWGVQTGTTQTMTGWSNNVSIPIGTLTALEWTIDWDQGSMSLTRNGTLLRSYVFFTYLSKGFHRIEFGHCGLAASPAGQERFDNLSVEAPNWYALGGVIRDRDGNPCSRNVRILRRNDGLVIATTRSADGTGEWSANAGNFLCDVQVMAEGADACDRFLPGRMPVLVP